MKELIHSDPLAELTKEDRRLLWDLRHLCKTKPEALPKVLLSADWTDAESTREAHRMLEVWVKPTPKQALDLLDAQFADVRVRTFAVEHLAPITDEELANYALQLVQVLERQQHPTERQAFLVSETRPFLQVLKYETHHDSPLACFLIMRSLRCPNLIGHIVFWHLKAEVKKTRVLPRVLQFFSSFHLGFLPTQRRSRVFFQMHVPEIAERYGVVLELYLEHCGAHLEELMLQNQVMLGLIGTANAIKDPALKKAAKLETLRRGLREMVFPARFSLPLNPTWICKGLKVEKCKYMDSKKLPLWLVFENAEEGGKDIYVIFKAGDDLRQDLLTLQLFTVMHQIWMRKGLDLKLIPYGCVATGDEIGMIEVVLDSDTTANITFDESGGGVRAAWDEKVFTQWLQKSNKDDNDMDKAVNTFAASCAGYCVATYALGIGDRHSDNVMVKRNGNLFHIDFGHFLGNYKSKCGHPHNMDYPPTRWP